jgi:hypothetical protein
LSQYIRKYLFRRPPHLLYQVKYYRSPRRHYQYILLRRRHPLHHCRQNNLRPLLKKRRQRQR